MAALAQGEAEGLGWAGCAGQRERESRAPPPLRPEPPPGPQPGANCLGPSWRASGRESPSPPHRPYFGRRSNVAFVEAEARVWPQGRAGQEHVRSSDRSCFSWPLEGNLAES